MRRVRVGSSNAGAPTRGADKVSGDCRNSEIIKGKVIMKSKLTVLLVVLLFAVALFAQTAAQTPAPKADAKACACCTDKDGKTMDCCKDGKCCADGKMCARKDGKGGCCAGMKDGKMADCCKGGKCPMMKGDKTAANAGCCGGKCDRMKHDNKGI